MKVTVGLLQHACSDDPAANLKKALTLAERAAKRGANIICTQELFRSQYFCQAENHDYFKLAEDNARSFLAVVVLKIIPQNDRER